MREPSSAARDANRSSCRSIPPRLLHTVARGFARHQPRVAIAGVILNRVATERHRSYIADAVMAAGIPVFGAFGRGEPFVLPSRHEGMPLALLEAMDVGLPVVATRVIGSAEVVVEGDTGLLVRPRDPVALERALARLLADPALRERFGRTGRRRFAACFTADRMARDTVEVYERVLARAEERQR